MVSATTIMMVDHSHEEEYFPFSSKISAGLYIYLNTQNENNYNLKCIVWDLQFMCFLLKDLDPYAPSMSEVKGIFKSPKKVHNSTTTVYYYV